MHARLRVVFLVAAGLIFTSFAHAQPSAALPPIFEPRPVPGSSVALTSGKHPSATTLVSERARLLMHAAADRMLENAEVFTASPTTRVAVDEATGITVMAPLVVKGTALSEAQVRPPQLQLMRFVPIGGDKYRRLAGGVTAPVYHTFIGNKELQVDFSILNGAGKGLDHQADFTRAEIAFRFKW